uniref:EB domain-containing protein n=1 Tax=Ditylenchus dipsaci TaxID=166011 RepID=A0A915E9G1_9BILA
MFEMPRKHLLIGMLLWLLLPALPLAKIGSAATEPHDQPCIVLNSICLHGMCECLPMYHPNGPESVLLIDTESSLGKNCYTSSECRGNGEYCNERSYKCECVSNFVEVTAKCFPGIFPGNFGCVDSRQCSVTFPEATCSAQGKCSFFTCFLSLQLLLPEEGLEYQQYSGKDSQVLPESTRPPTPPSDNAASTVSGTPPESVCSSDSSCAGYPWLFVMECASAEREL